jgi:prophage regulatory protein
MSVRTRQKLPADDRLIRMPEVLTMIGLRKSWLYDAMAEGRFPRGRKLSPHKRGVRAWPLSEIRAWIDEQPSA